MGYGFRRHGWGGPSYRSFGGGGMSFGYGLTPVVKKLIIANAAVYFLMALLGIASTPLHQAFVSLFGLMPLRTVFQLHVWQPLTYLFLHAGFMHIFFNMFALWMFGTPLERDWGSRRFLRYYLFTGVGAGALNVAVSLLLGGQGVLVTTIGASGAIFGILLAFGLLYPHTPILVWFLFPVPARIFVLVYGGLTFLAALQGVAGGPTGGISHVSHLYGLLFGFLYLRGGLRGLYRSALGLYVNWRWKRARSKFEVYMREQDERERRAGRPDEWIN